MERTFIPHGSGGDWQAAATRVQNEAGLVFLALLLAIALAVLGLQWQHDGVLTAARCAAVGVALCEAMLACTGTRLVFKAWRRIRLRWRHVRRPYIQALRGAVLRSARVALLTWPLTVVALCLPTIVDLLVHVPAVGLTFAPLLLVFGMQWANACAYQALAAAVDASRGFPRVCAVVV